MLWRFRGGGCMIKTKTTLKKVVPASSNTFNGRITEVESKINYLQKKKKLMLTNQ